ncbi:MAG: translation initiation factor IF-2 N-terminal domain-containing protein [Myxococcota bacterium]
MSKVRVYEVARELGMKNKELVALFKQLGFSEVRNHMSAVEPEAVDRLKRKMERKNEPEVVEERLSGKVLKRRSKGRSRDRASAKGSAANDAAAEEATASPPGVVRRRSKSTALYSPDAGVARRKA